MTRVCVVTGGNKGIGYAIVKDLCKKFDGLVYLTSRDESRGHAAIETLKKEGLSPQYHQLDITDEKSVRELTDYFKSTYSGIDVVINNAGISYKGGAQEPPHAQAENTLAVNYFATKRFCHAIFPLLRPHARVVNVSSCMGHLGKINGEEPQASNLRQKFSASSLTEGELDDLMYAFIRETKVGNARTEGWPSNTYSVSKVGLCALTWIHQRMFNNDPRKDLVINACHPGYVATDMTSHKGPKTPDEGAVSSVHLALLPPDIEEPKGAFVWCDTSIVDWIKGPLPSLY